jgi:hypothetical protein
VKQFHGSPLWQPELLGLVLSQQSHHCVSKEPHVPSQATQQPHSQVPLGHAEPQSAELPLLLHEHFPSKQECAQFLAAAANADSCHSRADAVPPTTAAVA